jgi:hypothetical protein
VGSVYPVISWSRIRVVVGFPSHSKLGMDVDPVNVIALDSSFSANVPLKAS